MHFSFLSHDQMVNIGGSMIFIAAILLLIQIPLAIVEKVAQRNSEKRCTAITNGTYAGTKVMQQERTQSNREQPAPLVFEQVKLYSDGKEVIVSPRTTHGITSKTEVGTPLVIHYDSNNPAYCWAHTPSARVGASIWIRIFACCTVIAFVLGMVLIRFS